jgi:hypothetical protein
LQSGRRGRGVRHHRRDPRRLATYKEKILAIKGKIKSALFYPISVIVVAVIVTWIIMVFVIPSFKKVFANFGADLPAPTLIVMAISEWVVAWWWLVAVILVGTFVGIGVMYRRSAVFKMGSTGFCSGFPSSAASSKRRRSRDGRARSRRCSPRAFLWWSPSTRWAVHRATRYSSPQPRRSRPR